MAYLSPYLQLLLAKRNGDIPQQPQSTAPTPAIGNDGPAVSSRPAPDYRSGGDTAPTTDLNDVQLQPRSLTAADEVRNYDAGLHKDADVAGLWVPHKRNRSLEVLEGIGNVAASGVGVNLQSILHPRGTDEQQARRRLHDEQSADSFDLQRRKGEADIERETAASNRDNAYGDHLKRLEDQADLRLNPKDQEVGGRMLRKQPDGSYAVVYEPPAKPAKEDDNGFTLSPGGARYDHTGKLIAERAPAEKAEADSVDTAPLGQLEAGFRANAQSATAAANKAEADVKTYIAQKVQVNPNYDPSKDANVASLTAEAKRQREFAAKQTDKADQVAVKKVAAGSKHKGSAKTATAPQRWSKSRWAAANSGADINAAIKEAQRRGLQVVN